MAKGKRGRPMDPDLKITDMRSFRMDLELYVSAQAACWYGRKKLTAVIEQLLRDWVRDQERQLNAGKPFEVPDTEEFRAMQRRLHQLALRRADLLAEEAN